MIRLATIKPLLKEQGSYMATNSRKINMFLNHRQEGQSIIETAFLLTIVLLVIIVFISLGSAYYYRTNLHYMTANVSRILSLSELEDDAGQTQQDINDTISFYETDILFPIHTSDPERFTISWEEEPFDLMYTIYSVQAEYIGLSIPFLDPIDMVVRSFALKVEE